MDYLGEHIDNKFGGCDHPFDGVSEVTPPEEQYAKIKEAFEPVFTALNEVIKKIIPFANKLAETVLKFGAAVISEYPNKRVSYLALHGKPRVRKKNMRRIMKWYRGRYAKNVITHTTQSTKQKQGG